MKLRIKSWALIIIGVTIGLTAASAIYLLVRVTPELRAARGTLSRPAGDLTRADIDSARGHLEVALGHLDGPAGDFLGFIPVARQNVDAIRQVLRRSVPAVAAAADVLDEVDAIRDGGILENDTVRLDTVSALSIALQEQSDAIDALDRTIEGHMTGWLLPPVWDQLDVLLEESRGHFGMVEDVAGLLDRTGTLLGVDGRRTYLVMLVNNAEARASGGILSGLGTVSFDGGRVELGKFDYYADLDDPPYSRVPSPPDFRRRFSRYFSDTTRFVNTTLSPDVPEASLVASRLYRKTTGTKTDGAFIIDPRGVAALLPTGEEVRVPGRDVSLTSDELAPYIYSTAYEDLGGPRATRHSTLLLLGRAALEAAIGSGLSDEGFMERAATAVAGGHIRFNSFHAGERSVLDDLGVAGDLTPAAQDSMFVTVENWGGDKLDYWAKERLRHTCEVTEVLARCSSSVSIENAAPDDLNDYVRGGKKTPRFQNVVHIYVPAAADIDTVKVDGRDAKFGREHEDERVGVTVYTEIPPGEMRHVSVRYELALSDGYTFEATPQPLSNDPTFFLHLTLPEEWSVRGPGDIDEGRLSLSGFMDRTVRVDARPRHHKRGLSAAWARVVDFWHRPVL